MVVAAKQLQAADGRDRECRVQVHCGTHMVTVEGQSKGLNPVWNKPVVMEVLPDVQAVSFEVLDRLGTATNGGKWLGTLQVPLDELAEVRPALNARTKWTRRVPHPVLIGHAATGKERASIITVTRRLGGETVGVHRARVGADAVASPAPGDAADSEEAAGRRALEARVQTGASGGTLQLSNASLQAWLRPLRPATRDRARSGRAPRHALAERRATLTVK